MSPNQEKALVYLAGTLAGIHQAVKRPSLADIEGLDMVACGLEDVFAQIEALLTGDHVESQVRNS